MAWNTRSGGSSNIHYSDCESKDVGTKISDTRASKIGLENLGNPTSRKPTSRDGAELECGNWLADEWTSVER